MTLEEMRAALAQKALRLKELVGKDALTDEEKTEKRTLFTDCTGLKTDIEEAEEELRLLDDLDGSIVTPPPGKQPGHTRGQVISEPPIYRTFGEQLKDIVKVGNPSASGRRDARERLRKAEKRMVEDKTMDTGLAREIRAAGDGQVTNVASEGGHFVQTDFATEIIDRGFNNSAVLPKTQKRKLSGNSNSVEIYGIDETSRASGSRHGGVTVYTKAELEQYKESKAKFNGFEIKVNKLTGLLFLSEEVLEDASFLEGEVTDLFEKEFAFKTQDLLIRGSGVGEPLGVKNADCLVTVAKETSQGADSIVSANISKMKARVSGNAEFFGNRDIIPQLDTLTIGEGASARALFKQTDANSGILSGIPITFIEQCDTVGDLGDLILADWGGYITVTKGGLKKAESMHLKFDYGQKAIRWTMRFDGQPRWRSALTPYKGSATISPFIVLAART